MISFQVVHFLEAEKGGLCVGECPVGLVAAPVILVILSAGREVLPFVAASFWVGFPVDRGEVPHDIDDLHMLPMKGVHGNPCLLEHADVIEDVVADVVLGGLQYLHDAVMVSIDGLLVCHHFR